MFNQVKLNKNISKQKKKYFRVFILRVMKMWSLKLNNREERSLGKSLRRERQSPFPKLNIMFLKVGKNNGWSRNGQLPNNQTSGYHEIFKRIKTKEKKRLWLVQKVASDVDNIPTLKENYNEIRLTKTPRRKSLWALETNKASYDPVLGDLRYFHILNFQSCFSYFGS